ncbi:MAG TPA: SgcJ/EcaC family oxidoreductase [Stellaceae bacterium]|nr:SgcJ/EcaC family oxidoreductase [Stellaceae bacterium]
MKHVGMLAVVTIGLTTPALAEQAMVTDQQKQAVQAAIDKYITAYDAKDTKALAALYTDDAMLVGTYVPGTLIGRPAIEKYLSDAAQQGQFASKLAVETDPKSFVALGNDMILVSGTWADTLPTPAMAQANTTASPQQSGTSQPPSQLALKPGDREHGSWTAVDEVHGDDVLIRSLSYNVGLAAPAK